MGGELTSAVVKAGSQLFCHPCWTLPFPKVRPAGVGGLEKKERWDAGLSPEGKPRRTEPHFP